MLKFSFVFVALLVAKAFVSAQPINPQGSSIIVARDTSSSEPPSFTQSLFNVVVGSLSGEGKSSSPAPPPSPRSVGDQGRNIDDRAFDDNGIGSRGLFKFEDGLRKRMTDDKFVELLTRAFDGEELDARNFDESYVPILQRREAGHPATPKHKAGHPKHKAGQPVIAKQKKPKKPKQSPLMRTFMSAAHSDVTKTILTQAGVAMTQKIAGGGGVTGGAAGGVAGGAAGAADGGGAESKVAGGGTEGLEGGGTEGVGAEGGMGGGGMGGGGMGGGGAEGGMEGGEY